MRDSPNEGTVPDSTDPIVWSDHGTDMTSNHVAGSTWESLAWVGVDGATCAFGDAEALGATFQLAGDDVDETSFRVMDCTPRGLPLIAYVTMEDGAMELEVIRDATGSIVAARMCATNDVDEVEGLWRGAGELNIASGRCLAADPYCSAKDPYRVEFDVVPGRYLAEVFDFTPEDGGRDCLDLTFASGAPAKHPPASAALSVAVGIGQPGACRAYTRPPARAAPPLPHAPRRGALGQILSHESVGFEADRFVTFREWPKHVRDPDPTAP
jgi:hypothetical protein